MVSPSVFVQKLFVRADFQREKEMLFFVFFSIYLSESGLSNTPVVLSALFSSGSGFPIQNKSDATRADFLSDFSYPVVSGRRARGMNFRPLPRPAAQTRYFRVKRHSGLKTGRFRGILYSIDFVMRVQTGVLFRSNVRRPRIPPERFFLRR